MHAGFWVVAAFVLARLAGLLRLSVLAHLLVPEDFGLMALIVLVVGSLWALSDVGITSAVIQRARLDAAFLHTAWHLNWMRGALLALCCWLLAPVAAIFFARPELEMWVRWAALIPLIRGLESLGGALLQRDLDFRRRSFVDFSGEAVTTVMAIGLALFWQAGVGALFGGLVAGSLASLLASYLVHDYRPKPVFSREAMNEIWRFGGHLLGAGILIFAMTNLDDLVIGKILGTEQLGYYAVAFSLAGILTSRLVQLLGTVMFPALSEIREDVDRTMRAVGLSGRFVAGILSPIVCAVWLMPAVLVELGFGEHWLPAVSSLMILAGMGWVRGVASIFGPVLVARGRTAILHRMKWIEFAVFAVSIVPAVHMSGITGAAWVLFVVYSVSLYLHLRAVNMEIPGLVRHALTQIGKGVLPAVVVFVPVWISLQGLSDVENIHRMAALVFVAGWGVVFWFRERWFLGRIREMAVGK